MEKIRTKKTKYPWKVVFNNGNIIKYTLFVLLFVFIFYMIKIPIKPVKAKNNTFEAKIHGGITKTKSMALWEIYKYKDTELLSKSPLCYAPWRAYLVVDKYVEVKNVDNYNAIVVNKDLTEEIITDATFNKNFAKKFKGRSIYRIYYWLLRTEYTQHKKTAREVFEQRKGDCAGISSAFYVICKTNNIPVRYIIGWCGNTCHAWNMVRVKGKWFYVDCTMDRYLSKKLWKHYSIMEKW